LIVPKHAQRLARTAHVRAEMEIRKDQRVVNLRVMDLRGHVLIVAQKCYEVMNWQTVEAPRVTWE